MDTPGPVVLGFLLGLSLLAAVALWTRKPAGRSSLPLPPGPKPLPLIGNLLDMPTKDIAPTFREMGKKYGDVIYLSMLGQPMVVLNSYEAAVAILDAHSANTSDRPRSVMAELSGYGWQFVLQGYTQEWRARRKDFHGAFHPNVIQQYRPIHVRECRRFLQRLLDAPDEFVELARHLFGATIMGATYGIQVAEKDDPYVGLAEQVAATFSEIVVPGRYLVELLPSLSKVPSWFPGAGFQRDARRYRRRIAAARNLSYDAALDALAQGTSRPSVVAGLVKKAKENAGAVSPQDNQRFRDVAGMAYLAGADTSLFTTEAFFLAMVQFPEVQKKAQEELDAVIGPDRLPEFSDRDSLPYINAVVKEVIRWFSIVPLGVYHRAIEEEEYNGYRIPAGSILMPNLWAMSRNPAAYPEPEKFRPERFLRVGDNIHDVRDPEKFMFGFGRRICPGRHFANDALFLTVASVLHVFDAQAPLGRDGEPVRVAPEIVMDHFFSYPKPFPCRITPRSQRAEVLIRSSGKTETK